MNLVKIEGPSGSGKTTKLQAHLTAAGLLGVEVLCPLSRPALERSVHRAVEGTLITTLVMDDCSPSQIADLEALCRRSAWPGITVYAVVAACA